MFLTRAFHHLQQRLISSLRFFSLSCLLVTSSCAQVARPPCFLELPAYSPQGDRISSRVTDVHPPASDGDPMIDLLTIPDPSYRMIVNGSTLFFPKQFVGRALMITVESGSLRLKRRVTLTACQQRTSVVFGQSNTGVDVATSVISGRIVGCKTNNEWWVRVTPMFGGQDSPTSQEGLVNEDGNFRVDTSVEGLRYLVIVGRRKEPLRTLALNVVIGGKNDLGIIDVGGLCAQ